MSNKLSRAEKARLKTLGNALAVLATIGFGIAVNWWGALALFVFQWAHNLDKHS